MPSAPISAAESTAAADIEANARSFARSLRAAGPLPGAARLVVRL